MLRKPWFKYLAGGLAVLLVLVIAAPFVADVIVRQQFAAHDVAWKKISRDGFEWRITGFSNGAISAKQARFTLSTKPALALRNARVDMHKLMMAPANPPAPLPSWLYVSADPAMLTYGEHAFATGMRARLARGRLVASGPTMNVKGRLDGTLDLQFDGDVVVGEGKFDGVARVRMAQSIEIEITDARFADAQSHKVFAPGVSVQLDGPGIDRLSGTVASAQTSGTLKVSCAEDATTCRLEIEPSDHPFANMLANWPRADLAPAPVAAANASYQFKLGQLSRAP